MNPLLEVLLVKTRVQWPVFSLQALQGKVSRMDKRHFLLYSVLGMGTGE